MIWFNPEFEIISAVSIVECINCNFKECRLNTNLYSVYYCVVFFFSLVFPALFISCLFIISMVSLKHAVNCSNSCEWPFNTTCIVLKQLHTLPDNRRYFAISQFFTCKWAMFTVFMSVPLILSIFLQNFRSNNPCYDLFLESSVGIP